MPASSRRRAGGLCRRDRRIGRSPVEADRRRARSDPGRHRRGRRWNGSGSTSAGLCRTAGRGDPSARRRQEADASRSRSISSAGTVIGDVRRLRESIEHVLRNAIAYTEEGGQIKLARRRATPTGGDHHRRTMARASPTRTRPRSSTASTASSERAGAAAMPRSGSACRSTRQFVEAHGGTVALKSAPGKGTTVTLTIPRAAAMILADPPRPRRSAQASRRVFAPATSSRSKGRSARARPRSSAGCLPRSATTAKCPVRASRSSSPMTMLALPLWHADLYRIDDPAETRRTRAVDRARRWRAGGRMARARRARSPSPRRSL